MLQNIRNKTDIICFVVAISLPLWSTNQDNEMKYSEVTRKLKRAGCSPLREGGKHTIWHSPITDRSFPVPRHGAAEANPKTLSQISKQSGVKF